MVVLDGRLLWAPRIQKKIGKHAVITGNILKAECQEIMIVLNGGELNVELKEISEEKGDMF